MSFFSTRIDATGPAGNIFAVLGQARRLMRQIGVEPAKVEDMTARVQAAQSYGEALAVIREWFPVDTDEDDEDDA